VKNPSYKFGQSIRAQGRLHDRKGNQSWLASVGSPPQAPRQPEKRFLETSTSILRWLVEVRPPTTPRSSHYSSRFSSNQRANNQKHQAQILTQQEQEVQPIAPKPRNHKKSL
jgi:hypothetical protein